MDAVGFLQTAAAVADPTRLRMLIRLGGGPLSVGQLATVVDVTQPAASYHVAKMHSAGLVGVRRVGCRTVVRRIERRWASILAALDPA